MGSSYTLDKNGIYRPKIEVSHRDQEYDQDGFNILFNMQENHFWYRGRHRFLLSALNRYMSSKKKTCQQSILEEVLVAGFDI